MAQALGFRMISIVLLALITFPSFTLQSCVESTPVGNRMSQSGYATCHMNLQFEKLSLLYITGFQRKMGPHNDLRDIKKVKCCQPPGIHKDKPHTCTSADWDLSFSRYVIRKSALLLSSSKSFGIGLANYMIQFFAVSRVTHHPHPLARILVLASDDSF